MFANGTESNGLNHTFACKGIVEKSLGHMFITSSSSYFFNKIDFEHYLFNEKHQIIQHWGITVRFIKSILGLRGN